jgi:aminoglycoside/choline kinase family phosphotransferase
VNVARLLSAMPVPVPRILGHSDELGIIALQDLGDVTLQAHLGASSPAQHAALYRQAVSFIDTLQRAARSSSPANTCPTGSPSTSRS